MVTRMSMHISTHKSTHKSTHVSAHLVWSMMFSTFASDVCRSVLTSPILVEIVDQSRLRTNLNAADPAFVGACSTDGQCQFIGLTDG